jgi:hypothetical protein
MVVVVSVAVVVAAAIVGSGMVTNGTEDLQNPWQDFLVVE